MNKQSRKVLLGAATLAAIAGGSQNAHAATAADVKIDAKIVQAIAITANSALIFGTASETGTGGTITIAPNGTVTDGGSVNSITSSTTQVGEFQVISTGGVNFVVTLDAASATIVGPGAVTMKVNGFVWDPATAAGATGAAFPLTDAGAGTVGATTVYKLGGVLNVGAAQAQGAYTGTIGMTVAYQ